jgi:phosphocarrier protein FPr/phosphocarrier protein
MSLIITSPLRGWATTLDSVPDPVFAQRMMGDGVAIQPLGDTVVAPFDGEVVTLHDAGHAISLRSVEGAEVLIHIGLDTVMLKGEGFTPLVSIGQTVLRGDPLIQFDLDAVAMSAASLITPVIVTNAEAFAISRRTTDCAIGACEALMTLVPVQAEARRRSDDGTVIEQAVTLSLAARHPRAPCCADRRSCARVSGRIASPERRQARRCAQHRGAARAGHALWR